MIIQLKEANFTRIIIKRQTLVPDRVSLQEVYQEINCLVMQKKLEHQKDHQKTDQARRVYKKLARINFCFGFSTRV